jgi:hypothetical protein
MEVAAGYLGAEIEETTVRDGGLQFVKILPVTDSDELPVVKTGAFQITVVRREAQFTDQMQVCTGSGTQAGDVAGVGGDFRFNEYNVEWLHKENCIPLNPSAMLAFFSMQGYYSSLVAQDMAPLPP